MTRIHTTQYVRLLQSGSLEGEVQNPESLIRNLNRDTDCNLRWIIFLAKVSKTFYTVLSGFQFANKNNKRKKERKQLSKNQILEIILSLKFLVE